MKDENIFIRMSESEKVELKEVSQKLDIPFSQLAREAIREKIAGLKQTDPRLQAHAAQVTTNS